MTAGGGDGTGTIGGGPCLGSGNESTDVFFGDEPLVVEGVNGEATVDTERAFDFPLRVEWRKYKFSTSLRD